jgi:hypothetical protein
MSPTTVAVQVVVMSARLSRALTAAVLVCTLSVLVFPLAASAQPASGDPTPAAAGPPPAGQLAPGQPSLSQKPAKPSSTMAVTARSVRQGDLVTLSGGGFAPGAHIVVTFDPSAVVGTTTADDTGDFSLTVAVPANASGGQHRFQAEGLGPGGGDADLTAPVRVNQPGHRGSWVVPAVMVVVTLLICAAAWTAWTVLSTRRPVSPDR